MDLGEGLPRVPVRVGDHTVLTNDGGGYSVPVGPGVYRVFAPGTADQVTVGSENVAADFAIDPTYPWWPVPACS